MIGRWAVAVELLLLVTCFLFFLLIFSFLIHFSCIFSFRIAPLRFHAGCHRKRLNVALVLFVFILRSMYF